MQSSNRRSMYKEVAFEILIIDLNLEQLGVIVNVDEKTSHVVKLCSALCHKNLEGNFTIIKLL